MTAGLHLRLADPARDASAVAAIYRPAVESSVATFEEVPPSVEEIARRIRSVLEHSPWLVAEDDDGVVGYAYATLHRERRGYRWSRDVSVYVAASHHGRGVGRRLYDALLDVLRRQRIVNVYAGITLPNPASEALHRAIGMERIGVFRAVGWKLGAWRDVAWYGMRLTDAAGPPPEPIPLPDLPRPT